MDFYSHKGPEIFLKQHLQDVGDRSREIIYSKKINGIDENILSDVAYLIGILHDFGKYTTLFQDKLNGLRDKNDSSANHGLISALFTFELVNEYIKKQNIDNKQPYKYLSLMAYFVVKRHHLNLDDIEQDVNVERLFDAGFRNVSTQLKNLQVNKNQIKEEYDSLLCDTPLYNSFENIFDNLNNKYSKEINNSSDIRELIEELDKSLYQLKKEAKNIIYYLLVQLLYSVLIDSDKKHAGHIREIKRRELPNGLVEEYLKLSEFKDENKGNINNIRRNIRKSVLENINNSENVNQRIFTITAPTGTGKTLTSFSAALILRKKMKAELKMKHEPRIIYSLPFTSIIDQNFDVFDRVFIQMADFPGHESEYLLKHHHLSEIFYKTPHIDKEKDVDESLALIETWESEIIVTTFVQLFHTLIGYKNRTLKKFHNIANSIIILDEVQNIPIRYWKLVETILVGMSEHFNCRIILMTATKPLIFQEGSYKELVSDYEKYFSMNELNRVRLIIDPIEKHIEEKFD